MFLLETGSGQVDNMVTTSSVMTCKFFIIFYNKFLATNNATVGEVKIYTDDECFDDPSLDGECAILINYQIIFTLYKDENFTQEVNNETDEFMVGDTLYGLVKFNDTSLTEYLIVKNLYFNASCCSYTDDAQMTDIR